MKTICVIGSGYVGTTTAALLASAGHKVYAIDVDESKVAAINKGEAPFFEAGLDALVSAATESGNLLATTDVSIISEAEYIFSSVGTPDNPDGSPNLTYINQVAETVAKKAKDGAVFIQKSTVPVGTGDRLRQVIAKQIYVSNPEFLREGTAIHDSLIHDRIVLGSANKNASTRVAALFEDIHNAREHINSIAGLSLESDRFYGSTPEVIHTSISSAELIKVTANAFLALKISFANSVAKLADKSGADVVEVMHGVGTDSRIGTAFFNAGRGYGGGCFPKDVSGLISVAIDHGVDFGIMTAADELNQSMPGYIINKLSEHTELKNKKVAVLGLAFKAGTSDARKSPAAQMANLLVRHGAIVSAYDPEASKEAEQELNDKVKIAESMEECLKSADIAVLATDWPQFKALSAKEYRGIMAGIIFVDAMNCLDKNDMQKAGFNYIAVGR